MNTAKIEGLKQIAVTAQTAYLAEQARLAALGLNSKARYPLLKTLKAVVDSSHAAYAKYADGQINMELVKIIEADRPNVEAGARARSAWKQAKFDMANAAK